MPLRANIIQGKCHSKVMSPGEISLQATNLWANVIWKIIFRGNVAPGKCLQGKCHSEQMPPGHDIWVPENLKIRNFDQLIAPYSQNLEICGMEQISS
jgi:hypothetical protein